MIPFWIDMSDECIFMDIEGIDCTYKTHPLQVPALLSILEDAFMWLMDVLA